jgi:hypothetical protein
VLLGDLEEVRQKVEKYRERVSLTDHLSVKGSREAVASCYQYVPVLSCPSFFTISHSLPLVQSESDDDS